MKSRLRLRAQVPEDLKAIIDYLTERSAPAAQRFIDAVSGTLKDLSQMPGKGSPKHFRDKRLRGFRTWSVAGFRNYLIVYRTIEGGIEVFAVVHGARRIPRVLR